MLVPGAVADERAADAENVAITFDGVIVPAGNPEPFTFTFVTPATPAVGVVHVERLTCAHPVVGRRTAQATMPSTPTRLRAAASSALTRSRLREAVKRPVARRTNVPGSGTGAAVPPVVTKITARSPSSSGPPVASVISALKVGLIVTSPVPVTVMVSGLKEPVRNALTGDGFAPPTGIALPLNDSPSGVSVKYDGPNVVVEPSVKSTSRG